MLIPSRLAAKAYGTQVAGALFKDSNNNHYLVPNSMVPVTNEMANGLYHSLCLQGLYGTACELTDDEIHYIVHIFKHYQCIFINNIWTEIKKCGTQ